MALVIVLFPLFQLRLISLTLSGSSLFDLSSLVVSMTNNTQQVRVQESKGTALLF
jgi:hypothetical protein